MRIMEASRPTEAHRATQHGRTGEMEFSRSQHDCPVERAIQIFVGFTQEYSEKGALFRQVPGLRGWRRFSSGGISVWRGHTKMEELPERYHRFPNKRRRLTTLLPDRSERSLNSLEIM